MFESLLVMLILGTACVPVLRMLRAAGGGGCASTTDASSDVPACGGCSFKGGSCGTPAPVRVRSDMRPGPRAAPAHPP